MNHITQILVRIEESDSAAAERLHSLACEELLKLATAKLANEISRQILQATAFDNEGCTRLVGKDQDAQCNPRGHFFGAAANAKRRMSPHTRRPRVSCCKDGTGTRGIIVLFDR